MLDIIMATHAGMTTEEFAKIVQEWVATATHPVTKRPYSAMVYQPMLEVLAYLRANGFKTFLVSGGGIEFMRHGWSRSMGSHPSRSSAAASRRHRGARWQAGARAPPQVNFIDDKAASPWVSTRTLAAGHRRVRQLRR